MTDDRREHPFDRALGGDDRDFDERDLPEPGSLEFAEIERLEESLASMHRGRPPRLDRREDPELAALLDVAASVERPVRASTEMRPFRSFRTRARAAILYELEQDQRAAADAHAARGVVLPFVRRPLFAPVAAAAAAAALVVAVIAGGVLPVPGQGGSTQTVSNLTQETTTLELTRIASALATIQERTERGEAVPAPLLREVAESAARVANIIERHPEQVDRGSVETYGHAMRTSASVLESARTEPEAEGALANAQRATRDGDVVAARFLSADDEATEDSEVPADPTETPTPTPTPEPTEPPTPSPTPDAEDDDDVDETTPSPTPTPTPAADDGVVSP